MSLNIANRPNQLKHKAINPQKALPYIIHFVLCPVYIGVSDSMLYKLTANKEIPHYKPRGKMIYFAKEELDEWLLQNHEPTADEAMRMATETVATQPFLKQRRYGKRKKD